mmetsp:Transcript_686/g.1802  ORF Transcript_686/g.1802 Transcript_686/m.1802 type:complete len:323 (-) Transcript_686:7-975(-)
MRVSALSILVYDRVQGPVHVHDDGVAIEPSHPVKISRLEIRQNSCQLRMLQAKPMCANYRGLKVHPQSVVVARRICFAVPWRNLRQHQRVARRIRAYGNHCNPQRGIAKGRSYRHSPAQSRVHVIVLHLLELHNGGYNVLLRHAPGSARTLRYAVCIPQCEYKDERHLQEAVRQASVASRDACQAKALDSLRRHKPCQDVVARHNAHVAAQHVRHIRSPLQQCPRKHSARQSALQLVVRGRGLSCGVVGCTVVPPLSAAKVAGKLPREWVRLAGSAARRQSKDRRQVQDRANYGKEDTPGHHVKRRDALHHRFEPMALLSWP